MNDDFLSQEHHMRNLRWVGPSDQLRERVTGAAKSAWHQESVSVAWWIPMGRLGIAAVAALVIISIANYAGDRTAAGWQTAAVVKVSEPASEFDELEDAAYATFVRHQARGPRRVDMTAMREHQEKIQQLLDEQG